MLECRKVYDCDETKCTRCVCSPCRDGEDRELERRRRRVQLPTFCLVKCDNLNLSHCVWDCLPCRSCLLPPSTLDTSSATAAAPYHNHHIQTFCLNSAHKKYSTWNLCRTEMQTKSKAGNLHGASDDFDDDYDLLLWCIVPLGSCLLSTSIEILS